ncbi:MAG: GntR family transcriptional regulator [Anaerolineae bacterium]
MERVEQMSQAIKQKILDLEIDPIQPIDEKALVRVTESSLTLVQQALERLAEGGVVVKQRGRWYVARGVTISIMREIFEVRKELEGMCVRFAAERITPQEVAQIEQLLRDLERVKEGDNKALLSLDRKFHERLYGVSGNRFLARALEEMYTLVYRLSWFALDRMGSVRANVEEHRAILDAVKKGDGRRAEELIQQHISHFQQMVESLL